MYKQFIHAESGKSLASTLAFSTKVIFAICILLTIRYQYFLLNYAEFGDESETIVAAKMIAAGGSLYGQIFNHHGPLTFLPGVLIEKFGNFGIKGHRVSIAIIQLIALIAIYLSPLLVDKFTKKLYVTTAASVMILYLPEAFGHTYVYQVLTGILITIILSQYTLPTIMCPERLTIRHVKIGNFLIACLPFLAITYLPIAILFFCASIRKVAIRASFVGLITGFLFNIIFLSLIGSVFGFLAFHIYLNSQVLPSYNGGLSFIQLVLNAFGTATADLGLFTMLVVIAASIMRAASTEISFPWRVILVALGIGSLLMRGAGFHGLPYWYALLALPLVFFSGQSLASKQIQILGLLLMIVCSVKLSLSIPGDVERLSAKSLPESTEFSKLAQMLTEKDDRVIAYSFQNYQYLVADRLPASGHFFYLPWQEKYNENPKFGIKIDACKEISTYLPKLMLIDKWKVWDKYPWESYAGCVQALVDKQYIQLPQGPYYVRKDIAAEMGFASADSTSKMQPSAQLTTTVELALLMTSRHIEKNKPLKRIGIMLGTYGIQNLGNAVLQLTGLDSQLFVQQFLLADLADNKYRYFELDSKSYSAGVIVAKTGGGISTWETLSEKDGIRTCIAYEYVDGMRRFTPGCPTP